MDKYAILLSGGVSASLNCNRYKNDLGFAYTILVNKLGFNDKNVKILYSMGQIINYNNVIIPTEYASELNVTQSLINLKVNKDDVLFIMVSNHGSDGNSGFINLWGTEKITLSEFTDILNKIECNKIVVLGQCYGGNILNFYHNDTCIITANDVSKVTYTRFDYINTKFADDYDEFLYHFLSYLNGAYPDGNPINTYKNSNDIISAFDYASENDIYHPKNARYIQVINHVKSISPTLALTISEIPQMKNTISSEKLLTI